MRNRDSARNEARNLERPRVMLCQAMGYYCQNCVRRAWLQVLGSIEPGGLGREWTDSASLCTFGRYVISLINAGSALGLMHGDPCVVCSCSLAVDPCLCVSAAAMRHFRRASLCIMRCKPRGFSIVMLLSPGHDTHLSQVAVTAENGACHTNALKDCLCRELDLARFHRR